MEGKERERAWGGKIEGERNGGRTPLPAAAAAYDDPDADSEFALLPPPWRRGRAVVEAAKQTWPETRSGPVRSCPVRPSPALKSKERSRYPAGKRASPRAGRTRGRLARP
jgi:hypothetical protein